MLFIGKTRRRLVRNFASWQKVIAIVALFVLIFLGGKFLLPIIGLTKEALFGPVNVFSIALRQSPELKNDNGRTNILLLGIGGAGHDGPNLTDAMMVLSLKTVLSDQDQKNLPPIVLVSIPRDIYLDELQSKINLAYQVGLDKGMGTTVAKAVVSEVTGLPIHYAVVVDFSAFADMINILGGIDVTVEHTLDDPGYPIAGKENDTCGFSVDEVASRTATIDITPTSEIEAFPCRYEQLHFDAGLTHMDGATALKFVRSRHAIGDEGSDFARSRRQQLILKAIQNKVLSSQTLLSPQKILDIYQQFKDHISSDLNSSEINALVGIGLKYRNAQIKTTAIDENLLENPPVDARGWILLPVGGNWDQVHTFIQSQLESK